MTNECTRRTDRDPTRKFRRSAKISLRLIAITLITRSEVTTKTSSSTIKAHPETTHAIDSHHPARNHLVTITVLTATPETVIIPLSTRSIPSTAAGATRSVVVHRKIPASRRSIRDTPAMSRALTAQRFHRQAMRTCLADQNEDLTRQSRTSERLGRRCHPQITSRVITDRHTTMSRHLKMIA